MSKKRHLRNRIFACLLAAAMIIGEIPAAALKAYAAEEAQTESSSESEASKEAEIRHAPEMEAESSDAKTASETVEAETTAKTETVETKTTIETETAKTAETETIETTDLAETEKSAAKTTADTNESETAPEESEEPLSSEETGETYDSAEDVKAAEGYENSEITVSMLVGSKLLEADIKITPGNKADGSGDARAILFYKEASAATWKQESISWLEYDSDTQSLSRTCRIGGLAASTQYNYYITTSAAFGLSYGSESEPKTFTTSEVKTYQDSDFPDEAFRSFIRKELSLSYSSAPITSDKLETLEQLYCPRIATSKNISSIKGIEHMPFLTDIQLPGHTITDASYISGLTKLKVIWLNGNDLTQLPDLSRMANLSVAHFDDNKISKDSFTEEKLPAKFLKEHLYWIKDTQKQQRGEVAYKLAPEYYAVGEGADMQRPFIIKITNLKNTTTSNCTLSLTIGGKTASATRDPNGSDMHFISDIAPDITVAENTPQNANIKLTDSYGNTWLDISEELTFVPGINAPTAQTSYISPFTKECKLAITGVPSSVGRSDIKSIVLKNSAGKKVGEANLTSFYLDDYDPYEKIFGRNSLNGLDTSNTKLLSEVVLKLSEYLPAGDYSAILKIGEKEYTLEKAVCVPDCAQLTGLSLFDDSRDRDENGNDINFKYDNYGDYWYVELSGANIDPDKVWPVFYEGSEDITKVAGASQIYDGEGRAVIYKLEKLKKDTYWRESGEKAFRIDNTEGYAVINDIRNKTLYYDHAKTTNYVLFQYYDEKTQRYKIKLSAKIPDGTVMDISLYDQWWEYIYEGTLPVATARETVADGWISPDFKDPNNQPYTVSQSDLRLLSYSYTDAEGNKINFLKTHNVNNSVYLKSDYYQTNTHMPVDNIFPMPFTSLNIVRECSQGLGQTLPIFKSSVEVGQASFTPQGTPEYDRQNYKISWSASDGKGLDAGDYEIRDGGTHVLFFTVYDPAVFYMNHQDVSKWADDKGNLKGLDVRIFSENISSDYVRKYNKKPTNAQALAYWNDSSNKYKIEFFDYFKKPVEGWRIAEASWKGDAFSLKVTGLPSNATGYYVRVTKDDKPGKLISWDKTIYEFWSSKASNELGEWHEIQDWFMFEGSSLLSDRLRHCSLMSDTLAAYPLTVALIPPYDIVPAAEFKINASDVRTYSNDLPMYSFTADDLKDIDKDEIYRLRVTDKDGRIIYDDGLGYFWYDETQKPVNPPPTVNPSASIAITGIDGATGSYPEYYVEMGTDSSKTATLTATLTGNYKLTASSSDTKVIAIGSISANGGTYTIPLAIKSAGAAEITLTANDAKKTKKSIWLYVANATPLISTDLLTVNLKQTAGPRFFIYPHSGYTVLSADFDDGSKFNLKRMDGFNGMCWVVMPNKDADGKNIAIAKQTYDLKIKGKVEKGGTEFEFALPIKIKAADTAPKYKISQSEKINLFFKDGRALLNVSSNVPLGNVELPEAGCGFKVEKETDKKGTARYYLKAKDEEITTEEKIQALLKSGKKVKFKITFSGYEPIDSADYTVNAEYKIPRLSLSSKSATFYLNANSAVISVMNGKEKFALPDGTTIKCVRKADKTAEVPEFKAEAKDGNIFIENLPPYNAGSFPMQLELSNSSWSDKWYLPYTAAVKDTDEPAVKLSKAALKLNADEGVRGNDIATTELIWKDGVRFNADAGSFKCDGKDAKSQGIIDNGKISITYENDIITARLKAKADRGTYKFNAALDIKGKDGNPVKDKDGKAVTVAIPFSIAVSEDAPGDAVKLSQKGAIDVLDREGTYIAVTPALKSINGTVTGAALSDAAASGTDAGKFTALVDDDGKIRIQVKKDAAGLALNKDYAFNLSLTVTNADGAATTVTPRTPVKFKLKQGKPKVAVTPTGATFFSGKEISLERDVAVTLAGAQNPPEIDKMELVKINGKKPEAGKAEFASSYKGGVLSIESKKQTAKGKTYKLQFEATFKGQADEKPAIVSYSVKVK